MRSPAREVSGRGLSGVAGRLCGTLGCQEALDVLDDTLEGVGGVDDGLEGAGDVAERAGEVGDELQGRGGLLDVEGAVLVEGAQDLVAGDGAGGALGAAGVLALFTVLALFGVVAVLRGQFRQRAAGLVGRGVVLGIVLCCGDTGATDRGYSLYPGGVK
ncbi:MAG: hypothetical protein ACTJFY_00700 [Candidatus Corynebacterium faecigallinarum]